MLSNEYETIQCKENKQAQQNSKLSRNTFKTPKVNG